MVHFIADLEAPTGRNSPKPPPQEPYHVSEPPYEGYHEIDSAAYSRSTADDSIVIDNGSSSIRAGYSFHSSPSLVFPPLMARYMDRKLNRKLNFIGSEIYFDGTARGQAKNAYEAGANVVNNWDVMEGSLDYIFVKLGLTQNQHVDRKIVMTEPVANLGYTRKVMSEILFELYGAPAVAYGIDSLFSYNHNGGRTGLVVSGGYMATNLIPVLDGTPIFSHATRLDWGRQHCAEYLAKLLRAKYPGLPTKINETQIEDLVRKHCYISQDYNNEMARYLDWTGLEDRDITVQLPFVEKEVAVKTEEELARAAEKRKEGGRRLQEQAAKMRLDKLIKKEQELEYYKDLQQRLASTTKKEARNLLEAEDFDTEEQLEKKMREMEKSIRKQRNKDVGDYEEPEEVPTYPLLDIPDDQLDEEAIKQKKAQRLLKANHDARARAKAEKEREKARLAEEQRQDDEARERDPESWIEARRNQRSALLQRIRERDRLKADLGNRKSLASQMRMKSIANLASDNPKKRRRGGDDDDFGADDADWGIYRTIATGDGSDDEEEEDLGATLKGLEAELLKYDPDFTEQSTQEAQSDWTKSIIHAFLRGPYPYDPESTRENNQFHLNVERIRVPEVIFQPAIAGIDQAGVVEITENIVMQRLMGNSRRDDILKDVFLTGGYTMFQGFEDRLRNELRAVLPADVTLGLRRAKDPVLDAWRGAAGWASDRSRSANAYVSKAEFEEKGGEYLREHSLGNAFA
ncbi:Actin-like protein arp5 [Sphaceloma murrayae]|uniref:Actin-like protein arp5 n=1 Tax=Sphaceloma murrayae TaxID=2082308 RepID=A0A2K1QL84_9PEZI|nr:Actin-like protein arp5 [Sphaceloma murrayae]